MSEDDSVHAAPGTPAQTALLEFLLQIPFTRRDDILALRDRFLYRSSCACGCPSFSAHVDGAECTTGDWKLTPEAATVDDENALEVLLFGCEQGVHVEVVDHAMRRGLPLPSPSELTLLADTNADDGSWS